MGKSKKVIEEVKVTLDLTLAVDLTDIEKDDDVLTRLVLAALEQQMEVSEVSMLVESIGATKSYIANKDELKSINNGIKNGLMNVFKKVEA